MNDYREYSNYLMHYGRKGMKWNKHVYGDEEQNTNGDENNTSLTGNPDLDKLINQLPPSTRDSLMAMSDNATEAQKIGDQMTDAINNKNYGTAFDLYKNASPGARAVINEQIKNTMIAPALGNGDATLGRKRIAQGEKIAEHIWNSGFMINFRNGVNMITGRNVRITGSDKDIRNGHRKR